MNRQILVLSIIFLLISTAAFAQTPSVGDATDATFWVDRWSRPPVILYGSNQEAFYGHMQLILFPWDDHDNPANPAALDSNIQWLKDHPEVHFYVNGYSSSPGTLLYNLGLAQRRADWVKQVLVSRGIAEDRIKQAAGWGELYPVCQQSNDECWNKNQIVRLVYSPD